MHLGEFLIGLYLVLLFVFLAWNWAGSASVLDEEERRRIREDVRADDFDDLDEPLFEQDREAA